LEKSIRRDELTVKSLGGGLLILGHVFIQTGSKEESEWEMKGRARNEMAARELAERVPKGLHALKGVRGVRG